MKRVFWTTWIASAIALAWGGCTCGSPNTPTDAGDDSGIPVTTCAAIGEQCSGTVACCTGVCGVNGACEQGTAKCGDPGAACVNNVDCCTGRCDTNKQCSSTQCSDNGAACTDNNECCTANCAGTVGSKTCQAIPGSATGCDVLGQGCSAPSECCSKNCQGGKCVAAYTCRSLNDLCFDPLDCCSGLCSKSDGTAGYCMDRTGGKLAEGDPCTSGTNCTTRICANPGTGTNVCLAASGCRMTDSTCFDNQSCCGGGTNPNGSVQCVKETSTDVFGVCNNGTGCNPVGNICKQAPLPDGGTVQVNASTNCCNDRPTGNGLATCKLDQAGIPRCFGGYTTDCPNGYTGQTGCCIAEGQVCQFKDQCCNGAPCVADSQGVLRCTSASCTALGQSCSATSECCSGECLATGELGGKACQVPSISGDAGVCKSNGQTCTNSSECCSTICNNGTCAAPTECQGTGGTCSTSVDCCTGLSCQIPAGSAAGTCQAAACANGGQACSPSNPCCSGLQCLTPSYTACDGTTACTCNFIIN